jgi:membrane fusion protein, macrolide-specific efflux system
MVNNTTTQSPGSRRALPIIIVVVLALIGIGYYAYHATRKLPATVERRDIVGYVPLKGQIVTPPSAYAEAHASYTAPVDKVYTTLGAYVKRGDVLVQLANPSATENYDQARENVRAAETAYANAKRQYDDAVTAARKQAAAAAAGTQNTTSSSSSAPDSTTVTTSSSTTTTDTGAADAAVQQAIADRTAGLAAYQAQLDSARAAYRDARAGKRQAQVRAPISGTVIALNAQPGQTAGRNNAPVAVVADLSALQVQAGMTPEQAAYVKPELPVVLTFDTVPGRQFDGTVQRITTQADPNSSNGVIKGASYVAIMSFKNTDGLVKPQATAEVSVKTGEVKGALAVPARAVARDETGKPVVRVLEDGKWRPVAVQTGMTDGRYVQVKSGLKEGETVQVTEPLIQASSTTPK